MENLSRGDAIRIIQAIRAGHPPPVRLIHHIHVGQERWLEGMKWYLENAKDAELSAVRFIVGDYGSGKTHFLRMTALMALQQKFVVSEVTLSRDIRLDRFDTVWRSMMSNLVTSESEGEVEGIEGILNRWCEQAAQSTEQLQQSIAQIEDIPNLDPDFRQVLRGYLQAWFEGSDRDTYLQWLKSDAVRPRGVRTKIDRTSARAMLRSLILFLRSIGYSGLVLFLDELELIREQSQKVRDANYDTLRQFVDDADNLRSFLLLCSVTPIMLEDAQKGFPSFPPLWQRIGGMLGFAEGDYRAITVDMNQASLTENDLVEVAKRLRFIHAIANNWRPDQKISDEFLQKLVKAVVRERSEYPLPRRVVQTTISHLEILQQNPEKTNEEALPEAIRNAFETIRRQERGRYRSWDRE